MPRIAWESLICNRQKNLVYAVSCPSGLSWIEPRALVQFAGFRHVTARQFARPSKTAFIAGLQSS